MKNENERFADGTTNAYAWILSCICLALLAAPALTLRNQSASLVENRSLASRPAWPSDWSEWQSAPRRWEAYLRDQYGGREEAILLSERLWFRLGLRRAPSVIQGREGWLFYGRLGRESPLGDYTGSHRLSATELDQWTQRLQGRSSWLRERGVPYLFAVAPNKMEIYGAYLPPTYKRRDALSRREQLLARLAAKSEVSALYLGDAIDEALKEGGPFEAFHRGGTHWNAYGAGMAFNEVAAWMAERGLAVIGGPLAESDYAWRRVTPDTDLARMIGAEESYPFGGPEWMGSSSWTRTTVSEDLRQVLMRASKIDLVKFGKGSPPTRALVFGDSFFAELLPYFSAVCSELLWVPLMPTDREFRAAVEAFGPDVVIEQRVERYLWNVPVD